MNYEIFIDSFHNQFVSAASSTNYLVDNSSVESNCEALLHELDSSLCDEDISNWLHVDVDDQGYQLLSDNEIIQQVTSQLHKDTPEDETLEDEAEIVPRSREATEMLDKCLLWCEQQPENTAATSVLLLKRVRDLAATPHFTSLKQTTLGAYFN